jgi:hypothetical protein
MEQSPSSEAKSHRIPCVLWNLKVHYHVQRASQSFLSWTTWISIFCSASKNPSMSKVLCNILQQDDFFTVSCQPLTQYPSWSITPYQLFMTAYSTCSQQPSVSENHILYLQPKDAPCLDTIINECYVPGHEMWQSLEICIKNTCITAFETLINFSYFHPKLLCAWTSWEEVQRQNSTHYGPKN